MNAKKSYDKEDYLYFDIFSVVKKPHSL